MTWAELAEHLEHWCDEIWEMMQQSAYAPYGELLNQKLVVMTLRLQEARMRAAMEKEKGEIAHEL